MRVFNHFQRVAVATAALALCGAAQAQTPDESCLDLGVTLCADWTEADGVWSASGDVSVETPLGPFVMANANLEAQLDPPALTGQVDVPMPNLGALGDLGLTGRAPRAEIALGYGAALEELEIGGQPMALDLDDTYLMFDYNANLRADFGPASISTGRGAGTLIIGPNEPLMYVGGSLDDFIPGGMLRDVAMGFSFDGRLPWQSENPLWDGETLEPRTLDGHLLLQGDIRMGRYPIWVHGHAICDLDANNDGDTLSDARDFRLGVDGAVDMELSAGPVSLTLPMGRASVTYDASQGAAGHLAFFAQDGGDIFADTALDFIEPGPDQQTIYGFFRDLDDFGVHYEREAKVMGFNVGLAQVEMDNDGVWFSATMQQRGMLPRVDIEGEVTRNNFELRGEADLQIAGYELQGAEFFVNKSGVKVAARRSLPLVGAIDLSGKFSTNGQVSMTGRTNVTVAGFTLSDAQVTLSNSGVHLRGEIDLGPLGSTEIQGAIDANGSFDLQGAIALDLLGLNVSNASVRVTNDGARVDARLNLGVATFEVDGRVEADGDFELTGAAEVSVAGFDLGTLNATVQRRPFPMVRMRNGAPEIIMVHPIFVNVTGRATLPGVGSVRFSGGVVQMPPAYRHFSSPFSLRGDANVTIAGLNIADGRAIVSADGVRVGGRVYFAGSRVSVYGDLRKNGSFDLEGRVSINEGFSIAGSGVDVEGHMSVEIDDGDLSAEMNGEACVTVNYVFGSQTACVGLGMGVNSSGKITVNLPFIGRKTIDIW